MSRAITNSKISGFDREWRDDGPFYEVWYGKVDLPDRRALWFRYKILDGSIQEASSWAVFFDADEIHGAKNRWWLDEVLPAGPVAGTDIPTTDIGSPLRFQERSAVFRAGDAYLDDGNALGTAGEIGWDLHWRDSGRRFCFIPALLHQMGIARSRYDACFTDLRVSGRVKCQDQIVDFEDATGMVGHIRGTKVAGHSWAWSHCNHFDGGEDAVFEGLSARALLGNRGSPLMTGLFLDIEDRNYRFHGPVQAFCTDSTYDREQWEFRADNGNAELTGRASAPGPVALVSYIDTDGSSLWCYNSKLGNLELHLTDRARGIEQTLHSTGRTAYETVTRDAPVEDVVI